MLLASDLDGTLIPVRDGLRSDKERDEFSGLCSGACVRLAYVSGRHLGSAISGIDSHGLPLPEVLVCDVGTSIFMRDGSSWEIDREYESILAGDWSGLDSKAIGAMLADIQELSMQEPESQARFKVSYYFPKYARKKDILERVSERLQSSLVSANLIFSVDSKTGVGLLDILPKLASKSTAVEYLRRRFDLSKDEVIYAGDSGNDIEAFLGGYKAILVANTPSEVEKYVCTEAKKLGIASRIYCASKECIGGVLEGCRYFGLMDFKPENCS